MPHREEAAIGSLCATWTTVFESHTRIFSMNRDQIKGAAKYIAGKVQEGAGSLIGSPEQIVRGLTRQVAGKAQKGRGDVRQKIKDFNKAHPR
jgi:uncharacterized protein YjbJ (UPF0337 family)